VDTPIELRADAEGRIAGINANIARSSDGRFFSVWRSDVYVWSPDGRFLGTLGRQGSGPGEFRNPRVQAGADGRIYALDFDRWTVFSPDLELLGTRSATQSDFGGPGGRTDTDGAALLDDGTYLSGDYSTHRAGSYFVVWELAPRGRPVPSGAPEVVRQFDPIPPAESLVAYGEVGRRTGSGYRAIGYAGGDTFWAGPPMLSGRGYELELWRTDGTKLRTLRRPAEWFPPRPVRPGDQPGIAVPPPSAVGGVFPDGSGLLYVLVQAPNRHWRPPPAPESGQPRPPFDRNNPPPSPFDVYLDVIDPASGSLLAALGPIGRAELFATLPAPAFRGTSLAARLGETAEGLSTARIVEWRLFAR
jgi:hypothetical protein